MPISSNIIKNIRFSYIRFLQVFNLLEKLCFHFFAVQNTFRIMKHRKWVHVSQHGTRTLSVFRTQKVNVWKVMIFHFPLFILRKVNKIRKNLSEIATKFNKHWNYGGTFSYLWKKCFWKSHATVPLITYRGKPYRKYLPIPVLCNYIVRNIRHGLYM